MRNVHLASVDLNLLVILDELLRSKSTVAAAQRLGKPQSTVSHALGKLREVFGDPLFVRVGNGLVPTTFAEGIELQLRETLGSLEQIILQHNSFDPAKLERRFTISAADYTEAILIPRLLRRIQQCAPNVDVFIRYTGAEQDRMAQSGEVDLALGTNFQPLSGLLMQKFFIDPYVSVVRKGNSLAREHISVEEYVAAEHALVVPRGTPGSVVDDVLERLGLRRRIVFRSPHFMAACLVVAQSDLICTLPECFVRLASRLLPLHMMPHPLELPPVSLAIVYAVNRQHDPAHAWFRRCLLDVAHEIKAEMAGTSNSA
jgi:DNA-binding transcriptional LysR family regulator